VQNMYSFLSEYFSSVVLVLHASKCRVARGEATLGFPGADAPG
jgi:hypothetical protein